MRQPRIKIAPEEGAAVYHCMSRTVNGERLFDEAAREVLRRQFWQLADYCGVQVITYAILSNHFHVLIRVPQRTALSDAELLRRYRVLYPKPTRYQTAQFSVIRSQLAVDGPDAVAWRQRQLALMGDVSQYMKLVKQRFTIWFNKAHDRYGTLWAERFKSVLVEPMGHVVQTMAAYIDLNCVRAGLVRDPKDYRFCGYAEAVAGEAAAQCGLISFLRGANWFEAQAGYRQILFGTGVDSPDRGRAIRREEFRKVLKEGGRLPLTVVLRCRVRYFTDGGILGSKAFVARHSVRRGKSPQEPESRIPLLADGEYLTTMRRPRGDGIELR